jgi:hypothetical protein
VASIFSRSFFNSVKLNSIDLYFYRWLIIFASRMKRKKFISFFLVLVLSIQLLPLKQMIGWLIANQVTEEICHSEDAGKRNAGLDEVYKLLPSVSTGISPTLSNGTGGSIQHDAEALTARHADDIPTPPPNC